MSKIILHSKNNNSKIILKTLIAIIPLIIYGIYKNGYLLYQRDYINIITIFKPLILVFIALVLNTLVEYLFTKKLKLNYTYLYVIILCLFVSPNINLLIFTISLLIGLVLVKLLSKKITMNSVSFLKLFIVLAIILFGTNNYANLAESLNIYSYNILDIICGRNTGGIASTNILLGLIIYFYLSFDIIYKKSVFPISYIIYSITTLIIYLIFKDISLLSLLNSTVILAFILVCPINETTPATGKGILVYSLILGILTAILSVFLPFEGVFIACLLLSFSSNIIDRVVKKISLTKTH